MKKEFQERVIDGTTGVERPRKLRTELTIRVGTLEGLGTLTRTVLVKWWGWDPDGSGLKNEWIKKEE